MMTKNEKERHSEMHSDQESAPTSEGRDRAIERRALRGDDTSKNGDSMAEKYD